MKRLLLALSALLACEARINWPTDEAESGSGREGSYMVVAPSTLRPGLPYSVSVSLLEAGLAARKLDVRENVVVLEVRDARGVPRAIQWRANVVPGEPATLLIPPEETRKLSLGGHRVHLKAETKAGKLIFEGDEYVSVQGKPLTPFVQTDKAAYKPENTVRFRTLVVDPQLLPHKGNVSVKVKDPKSNVVQLYNTSLTEGVLSRSFNLTSQPPLGTWQIEVTDPAAGGAYLTSKSFSVEKYVLPKFEVKLEAAEFTQIPDPLDVKVVAKYTYGKGISGTVKVFPRDSRNSPAGEIVKTGTLENGEATVTFTFEELFRRNLLDMYRGGEQFQLGFVANVTEDLTNIVRSAQGSASLYKHGVQIDMSSASGNYKPGLDYVNRISVKNPDSSVINPTWNRRLHVTIDYTFPNKSVKTVEDFVTLDAAGKATQTIPTLLNSTRMNLKAYYHRREGAANFEFHKSFSVTGMKSSSGNFLQLKNLGKRTYTPGDEASLSVTATEEVKSVLVQVLSRGYVVWGQEVPLGGRSGSIAIPVTTEMSPKARVVVFTVRDDESREVLVDVAEFDVEGFFKNNVTLEFSQARTTPGAEKKITLRAKAEPGSLVCLMAIDKSVELLRSGFDVTAKDVENAIVQGNSGSAGGAHAKAVFDNAMMTVMTDTLVFDGQIRPPIAQPMSGMSNRRGGLRGRPDPAPAGFGGGGPPRPGFAAGFAGPDMDDDMADESMASAAAPPPSALPQMMKESSSGGPDGRGSVGGLALADPDAEAATGAQGHDAAPGPPPPVAPGLRRRPPVPSWRPPNGA